MPIHVRKAVPGDYEAVERIMKQVQMLHVHLRPDIYTPADPVVDPESYEQQLDRGVWWIAETDGIPAGVMEIYLRHYKAPVHTERKTLYIAAVAVDEALRTQGIGHALLEKARELCTEARLDGVELQVSVRNTSALRMYESFGFVPESINMELLREEK